MEETLPALPLPETFLIMMTIMILRYLAGSFVFFHACRLAKLSPLKIGHSGKIKHDIYYSLLASVIFAGFGSLMIKAWHNGMTQIYLDPAQHGYWYLPVSLILYLFIHDTYFYWSHRLLHKFYHLKIHHAHHESRIPTAWTSFSFHPVEALLQAIIIPALVLVIPVHISVLLIVLTIMTAFGLTNHLGYEIYPSFLEKKLSVITARHHQVHHSHLSKNFGLYFTFWDKWMGTEHNGAEA